MADLKILYLHTDGYPAEVNPAGTDMLVTPDIKVTGDVDLQSSGKVKGANAATSSGDALVYGQSGASLAGLALTDDIDMNGNVIAELGTPVNPGDAASKSYVDYLVAAGITWREVLLDNVQLNDSEGILSAVALTMADLPATGDTITLTDGTTTRTYGAGTGGDVQYTIGGTVAATMQNLATAITGDASGAWDAHFTANLDTIDTDGVVVIYEAAIGAALSKVYGTWATAANCKIVDFTGLADYNKSTLSNMPGSAPTDPNFGFHRADTALNPGELHQVRENDVLYAWNDDASTWISVSGPASIPDATAASGGGTKGKITVDSDFGLSVTSGVLKIKLDTTDPGLDFDSSTKGLQIKIHSTTPGLEIDGTNGLRAKWDGNHGIIAGATGLELELASADRLSVGASGLDVVGLPSLFKINGTAVGATVTAPNLDELTNGSETTLHSHAGSTASERISHTYTAAGAITKADPVYVSGNDTVTKAVANDTIAKAMAIGVALANIGDTATGTIVEEGVAEAIFSGQTAGARYFVGATGGLTTSAPGSGNHVMQMGFAKNATDFLVQKQYMGKKA